MVPSKVGKSDFRKSVFFTFWLVVKGMMKYTYTAITMVTYTLCCVLSRGVIEIGLEFLKMPFVCAQSWSKPRFADNENRKSGFLQFWRVAEDIMKFTYIAKTVITKTLFCVLSRSVIEIGLDFLKMPFFCAQSWSKTRFADNENRKSGFLQFPRVD